MDWVKRNLYFVIGSAVALVLMGLAALYLFSGWKHKNEVFEKLGAQYTELKRLYDLDPNPGSEKVNNIKAAKEQQELVRQFATNAAKYFEPIAPIPSVEGTNKVSGEEFASQLRRTVDQLQRDASAASVTVPASYNFSFKAQEGLMRFAPGSLDLLAVQLGEVKAICDILFKAKINALDNLRRERVSADDQKGPYTDFISQKSATNELAILSPYEVTFRCFSTELAEVLNGFHKSPYPLLVKTIDVEPAPAGLTTDPTSPYGMPESIPGYVPQATMPDPAAAAAFANRYGLGAATRPNPEGPAGDAFARRYGGGGRGPEGMGGGGFGGVQYRPLAPGGGAAPQVGYAQPVYGQPAAPGAVTPGTGRSGLQTVLNEKPLKVTMLIHVVKLLPKDTNN